MEGVCVASFFRTAGLMLLMLSLSTVARPVRAESVEVQAVTATDPGKPVVIPASLKRFETQLKEEPFGTFADSGHDTVTANAGGAGAANVGGYAVEVAVQSKAENGKLKVQVTIKQGGKALGQPWKTELVAGRPMRMKAGEAKAPVIFFFTFKE